MNKKLIALAVAAASISSVANAAEVYSDETSSLAVGGRLEARAVFSDGDVSDASRVRMNIAGKTDITDTIYGIGFYEGEYTSSGSSADNGNVNNRHLNAGIGGDFGKVVYGKTDGSLGMLTDFTDIMSFHGNNAGNKIAAADRTSNNLAYVGSFDIAGDNLTVKANYSFEGVEDTTTVKVAGVPVEQTTEYGDGYSIGAMYVMDMGLGFGAGYGEQDRNTFNNNAVDDTQKQAFGAISYTYGDFYVAGLYQDARKTVVNGNTIDNSRGYEVAAAYTYGKTVFVATYNYLEDTDASGDAADLRDAIAIDATHYFNKNFRTYASYQFDLRTDADDQFVLGARYDF